MYAGNYHVCKGRFLKLDMQFFKLAYMLFGFPGVEFKHKNRLVG